MEHEAGPTYETVGITLLTTNRQKLARSLMWLLARIHLSSFYFMICYIISYMLFVSTHDLLMIKLSNKHGVFAESENLFEGDQT